MNPRDFAERALLGTLLHEPGRVRELDWLDSPDFSTVAHQQVFTAVCELVAEHDTATGGIPTEPDSAAVDGVDAVAVWQRVQDSAEHAAGQHPTLTAPGLHALMQTAPPAHSAQPAVYGQMVLESSIRRQITQDGMRVGHAAHTTELATMLAEVGQALEHVDDVAQRWGTRPGEADLGKVAETLLRDPPTAEQRSEAEHALVEHVLSRPDVLDELPQLEDGDFADPAVAATLQSAADLHATPDGPRVDPVTVAWHQQRLGVAGLSPEQLAATGGQTPVGDPHHYAEVVLRGSLASRTATAADVVQRAAQEPTLQPEAVLQTARNAYQDVQHTAKRASAAAAPHPAQLAARGQGTTLDAALRGPPAPQQATPGRPTGITAPRDRGPER